MTVPVVVRPAPIWQLKTMGESKPAVRTCRMVKETGACQDLNLHMLGIYMFCEGANKAGKYWLEQTAEKCA
jgi:hypothetical protein